MRQLNHAATAWRNPHFPRICRAGAKQSTILAMTPRSTAHGQHERISCTGPFVDSGRATRAIPAECTLTGRTQPGTAGDQGHRADPTVTNIMSTSTVEE